MTSDKPPTTVPNDPASEAIVEPDNQPSPGPVASPALDCPDASRRRRTRQIISVALIVAGFALLIITLRAQNLGLAPTEGASRTQVTTGVLGTILLVTGLALIVQAFESSDEPPSVE